MDAPSELTPYLILAVVLLVPAVVFFAGFTFIRMRRSKFRHQRTQRHSHSSRAR